MCVRVCVCVFIVCVFEGVDFAQHVLMYDYIYALFVCMYVCVCVFVCNCICILV